jgi:hypothetical protein
MTLRIIILNILLISVFGCSTTAGTFFNRPVVEDQLIADFPENGAQEIGTLAVTADRRVIIGNLRNGKFCAEPPPETADSITSAIASALSAKIAEGETLDFDFASNFAKHVNQLYKRSHTVALLRDAGFYLCVDAVNQAKSGAEPGQYQSYKTDFKELVVSLTPTLTKEIELYYATETARANNPPNGMVICNSEANIGNDKDPLSTSITCQPIKVEAKVTTTE